MTKCIRCGTELPLAGECASCAGDGPTPPHGVPRIPELELQLDRRTRPLPPPQLPGMPPPPPGDFLQPPGPSPRPPPPRTASSVSHRAAAPRASSTAASAAASSAATVPVPALRAAVPDPFRFAESAEMAPSPHDAPTRIAPLPSAPPAPRSPPPPPRVGFAAPAPGPAQKPTSQEPTLDEPLPLDFSPRAVPKSAPVVQPPPRSLSEELFDTEPQPLAESAEPPTDIGARRSPTFDPLPRPPAGSGRTFAPAPQPTAPMAPAPVAPEAKPPPRPGSPFVAQLPLRRTGEVPRVNAGSQPPAPVASAALAQAATTVPSPVARPEPTRPEPTLPDRVRPEPVRSEAVRSAAVKSEEIHFQRAALWRRLVAGTVDTALLVLLSGAYLAVAARAAGIRPGPAPSGGLDLLAHLLQAWAPVLLPGAAVALALGVAYAAIFGMLLGGRSPGRFLAGIRLVDGSGAPPGPVRAVVRAVLSVGSLALLCAGFWLSLFDRRGQTLHDKLSGTFVVQPSRGTRGARGS